MGNHNSGNKRTKRMQRVIEYLSSKPDGMRAADIGNALRIGTSEVNQILGIYEHDQQCRHEVRGGSKFWYPANTPVESAFRNFCYGGLCAGE